MAGQAVHGRSVKEKLRAEFVRAGCFLADLVCYFDSSEDEFLPEFFCSDPALVGCPADPEQIFDWLLSSLHVDDEAVLRDVIRRVLNGNSVCGEIRLAKGEGDFMQIGRASCRERVCYVV